ncbi:MAG: S8 family serine peptidase, partial [Clostridiales bacterium]|nr:S8 family serine peptidase [Clostridiales bacterium]
MAQNLNVEVILMALSVKDNGEYDAFKELVWEAEAKGIKIIASAGNNNADAEDYLPAGISGVITVGAITEDG